MQIPALELSRTVEQHPHSDLTRWGVLRAITATALAVTYFDPGVELEEMLRRLERATVPTEAEIGDTPLPGLLGKRLG